MLAIESSVFFIVDTTSLATNLVWSLSSIQPLLFVVSMMSVVSVVLTRLTADDH